MSWVPVHKLEEGKWIRHDGISCMENFLFHPNCVILYMKDTFQDIDNKEPLVITEGALFYDTEDCSVYVTYTDDNLRFVRAFSAYAEYEIK